MQLDISEEYITETGRFDQDPSYDRSEATSLQATSPSYTDPLLIVDGINRINVIQETDSNYLVHYIGYVTGYARVTKDGIREFGETYLADEHGIPDWFIAGDLSKERELPWWIPDSYEPVGTVKCDRCATVIPVSDLVTPGRSDGDVVDWFCQDCWVDVSDRWSPEWVHAGRADIHRAEYLDQTVGGNPELADIDELIELTHSEEEKARMHALTALGRIIPERAEDIISSLPVLIDKLENDAILTRFGALSCLALLAENDPEDILPAVNDVVSFLDPASDEGILEEAIRFVLAVSKKHPEEVQYAAPSLTTLLQSNPPQENELLEAIVNIAEVEPEAVTPVAQDLCEYIKNENAAHRTIGIAAVGHVAKESPEVAETTIPTMIDLLTVSQDRLRANAAGLLADLAEEYPEQLTYDLPQIIELVDDSNDLAQHNATYILMQIASCYPEDVEPAVPPLIEVLDADREETRINACQALGYVEAEEAISALEYRRSEDSSEEVRRAAGWAISQMSK